MERFCWRDDKLPELAASLERRLPRPAIMAIDGRGGAGKSTLAARLAPLLDATIIDGDAFYAGGVQLRSDSPAERAACCIDWRRQREVLQTLRSGRPATFSAFDWDRFDGNPLPDPIVIHPAPILILEGTYSARPELADLLDFRILIDLPAPERARRVMARDGPVGLWERQWHEAEDWYLSHIISAGHFDLVLTAYASG